MTAANGRPPVAPAVVPIEDDILPSRHAETDVLRIRRRMAVDVADLAALNGGATRDDMIALGWTSAQLVTHLAAALKLAHADAPPPETRPVKRIRRLDGPRAPTPRRLVAGFASDRAKRLERHVPAALMILCFGLAIVLTFATRASLPARSATGPKAADFAHRAGACVKPARGVEFAILSGDRP